MKNLLKIFYGCITIVAFHELSAQDLQQAAQLAEFGNYNECISLLESLRGNFTDQMLGWWVKEKIKQGHVPLAEFLYNNPLVWGPSILRDAENFTERMYKELMINSWLHCLRALQDAACYSNPFYYADSADAIIAMPLVYGSGILAEYSKESGRSSEIIMELSCKWFREAQGVALEILTTIEQESRGRILSPEWVVGHSAKKSFPGVDLSHKSQWPYRRLFILQAIKNAYGMCDETKIELPLNI